MTRVALRSVRTHIGQFLLTVLAVVLGVTFLSGTLALRGVLSDVLDHDGRPVRDGPADPRAVQQ